jgi:hypothetical protein
LNKDLVFIVSGGRTGTRFLSRGLSDAIPACRAVHEPDVLATHRAHWKRNGTRLVQFGIWHMVIARLAGRSGPRNLATRWHRRDLSADMVQRAIAHHRTRYYRIKPPPLAVRPE